MFGKNSGKVFKNEGSSSKRDSKPSSWDARGRWFESSRPDQSFQNKFIYLSRIFGGVTWPPVYTLFTAIYSASCMFLGKVRGKLFERLDLVGFVLSGNLASQSDSFTGGRSL
jgi:hypothetical protein